ncbi:MAG TPA: Xaa-Pro peptidase family protein [Holophaga sp.]|nr:Xaa-Pro peptidase family protein [Holophaga sp.]
MDLGRRLVGLRAGMAARGVDLAIYGHCPNFQYLTGSTADWREAPDHRPAGDLVLVPLEGDPLLLESGEFPTPDGPAWRVERYDPAEGYAGHFRAFAGTLSAEVRKVGLGAYLPPQAVTAALSVFEGAGPVEAAGLMDAVRAIKEPEEIARLRAAARLTDEAMAAVARGIREGVSQRDLMLEIEHQGHLRGASRVSFNPWACFVRSGSAAGGFLTDYPVETGLSGNVAITFDVGFVLDGYCSDWGRSLYWGKPPAHAAAAYAALRRAVVDTVAGMADGAMRADEVYPAIERHLDTDGFGDRMRARLAMGQVMGHQIGTEVHENPWLRPGSGELLREGMVLCVEPKLWLPGEYYLRLEEMVLVGKDGGEFLTSFDRELFVL